jgi:putative ABC transport system permease protein
VNTFLLSARLLLRQGRSGALLILASGLIVATAALVAVGSFTDRVGRALERQAGEALAADLVVAGRDRIPQRFFDQAQQLGLETAEVISVSTALFVGEQSQLVDVKAVSQNYPLRGQLRVAPANDRPEAARTSGPPSGAAWMDPRAQRALEASPGDQAEIGVLALPITGILTYEPDRAGGGFSFAPRLMMHLDDLLSSELLGPGSRARYRLLLAGNETGLQNFKRWFADEREDRQRLITVDDAEDRTGMALTQAKRFLGIAALTAVILAAVAILLSALRFSSAQRDLVALLKTFGASSGEILQALSLLLLYLVACSVVLGGVFGWIAQSLIAEILSTGPETALPPARLWPLVSGGLFTLLLAAGFALPPLLSLRKVPTMRILNRSLDGRPGLSGLLWLIPVAGALLIPVIQLGDARLAGIVLGGSAALAGSLALAGWLAMLGSGALAKRAKAAWRFGLAGLQRRRGGGIIQVTALGLGLMALLLLVVVRTELISQWRGSLPADTPDHFIINIQPDQVDGTRSALLEQGARNLQLGPMANANLVSVNSQQPPDHRMAGQVNVSWNNVLPPANKITAGEFFSPEATGEVSLAQMWAENLGIELGDQLTFESGARRFTATVTSIREVDWNSFNVNFFILLSPEAADLLPHQFIASFYLADAGQSNLRTVTRQYPNLSIIDVGALIDRVGEIIDQVSRAAQVVFAFTLLAGLVVLLAALESTRDERRHESALIRTLGADNSMVRRGLLIEYGVMAFIAALLATVGSAITGWLLAAELFEFAYRPSPALFALGFSVSAALVVGSGWLGNRTVLKTPPVRILRTGN